MEAVLKKLYKPKIIDLLDIGTFTVESDLLYYPASKSFVARGTYTIGEWIFENSEISFTVDYEDLDDLSAEEILEMPFENVEVYPVEDTKIVQEGDLDDLDETSFYWFYIES